MSALHLVSKLVDEQQATCHLVKCSAHQQGSLGLTQTYHIIRNNFEEDIGSMFVARHHATYYNREKSTKQ